LNLVRLELIWNLVLGVWDFDFLRALCDLRMIFFASAPEGKGTFIISEARADFILILPVKSGKIRLMVADRKKIAAVSLLVLAAWLADLPSAFGQTQVGQKAPGFMTTTLEGKRVSLKEYWEQKKHKAIVLSFFATWCHPCKEDLKYLQGLQEQLGSRGFLALAVHTQDPSAKAEAVKNFLDSLKVSLPVLLDEYGIIGKRYGVIALPCNVLIDQGGILRAKYLGYGEAVKKEFEGRLRSLLAPP
jgi:peroxiredoxin